MAPIGTFCVFMLIFRNPPTENGHFGMYVTQKLFANAHIGEGSPIFTLGKNNNFGKIFYKIFNWRLTVPGI